jgi:putative transposase
MPWNQTSPMDQRTQFIADYLRQTLSISELCEHYGVSRKTAYKWIDRYLTRGPAGLEERSRRPHHCWRQTPDYVVQALLQARRRHPSWGAKKLLCILGKRHAEWPWPHRATVYDILKRHGLIARKRRRRSFGHPGRPNSPIDVPNAVWSADFKGHFRTGDGRYCYPLTITDGYSRFLLGCQALHATSVDRSKPVFTRVFRKFGLPQRIRTDNGVPFAMCLLGALVPAVRVVGASWHLAGTHRAGKTAAEWTTRAHAPYPESRNDTSRCRQSYRAAAPVQSLP